MRLATALILSLVASSAAAQGPRCNIDLIDDLFATTTPFERELMEGAFERLLRLKDGIADEVFDRIGLEIIRLIDPNLGTLDRVRSFDLVRVIQNTAVDDLELLRALDALDRLRGATVSFFPAY